MHFLGQHAGEVMQGLAVAFTIGLTKSHLDKTIGIHPTAAEQFTTLNIFKGDGNQFDKEGC